MAYTKHQLLQPYYTSSTYPPPQGTLAHYLWRAKIRFEATWGLAMLETWEKVLVMTLLISLTALVLTSAYLYLPHHLSFLRSRAAYYLFGSDKAQRETIAVLADWWDMARALGGGATNHSAAGVVTEL